MLPDSHTQAEADLDPIGQYHWVAMLAPKHLSRSPSWYTAWISIGGLIVLTASSAFAAGLQYRALILITTPDYAPQPWHGLLFYWLILAYSLLLNLYGSKYLAGVNLWSGKSLYLVDMSEANLKV